MDNLNNYVDFWQYCNTLSDITDVDIDEVIKIVRRTFTDINNGVISSEKGFQRIEMQLTRKSQSLIKDGPSRSKSKTRTGDIPPSRDYTKRLSANKNYALNT